MRGADQQEYSCTCIVNGMGSDEIKDYHARPQKFAKCNENNLQIWKNQVILIFLIS